MSRIKEVLHGAARTLGGREISRDELESLISGLEPCDARWIAELMHDYPIMGMSFEISPADDLSGFGGLVEWLSPQHMIDEARGAYPGIIAVRKGYFPVCRDPTGSGDPYFVACASHDDPRLYRIYHDMVDVESETFYPGAIEVVLDDVADLFTLIAK